MKKRLRRTFEYLKTHKKVRILSVAAISVISLFFLVNFSRYVKQIIENYISRTERFYFNSDKLTEDNKIFEINYWPGAAPYEIPITVNSLDNNLRGTDIVIHYTISCTPGPGLDCDTSKTGSDIPTDTNKDTFTVTAVPTRSFTDGEETYIDVSVSASEPFEKTLRARFKFVVGHYGFTYKIQDEANRPYLESVITNTDDYYSVITAFGTHSPGERISSEVYNSLSDTDKAKCAGAVIKLTFDPDDFRLDMTNYYYQNRMAETKEILDDGYEYVNSFTFAITPQTSIAIKFYKIHVNNDYTYPIVNSEPIIGINIS